MAISSYEENGKQLWMVYVNIRSKFNPRIRAQKRVNGFEAEAQAIAEERKLLRSLTEKVARIESRGLTWDEVLEQWELSMKASTYNNLHPTTITDQCALLRRWTEPWLKTPAGELSKGDGREILRLSETNQKSRSFQNKLKSAINTVYNWGIEEKLIRGPHTSPVQGVQVLKLKDEKPPEILNIEEIRKFLVEAKRFDHKWYPVWAMALLTGMRSGELHELRWTDVELENRKLVVSRSYNTRTRLIKSTKAGYWRTVPISSELLSFLTELKFIV